MSKMKKGNARRELRLRNLILALQRVLLSINLTDLPARIRGMPDERTARFYTTAGLLSPPVRFDGRRAMYGKKHLLQLLAIKRLQSQNRPIRDILSILRGAGMAKLTAIAGVDPSIYNKAIAESFQDKSAEMWPRPSPLPPASPRPLPHPSAPSHPLPPPSVTVRTFRVHDGVYVILDPSAPSESFDEIRNRLIHFAHTFPQIAGNISAPSGGTT